MHCRPLLWPAFRQDCGVKYTDRGYSWSRLSRDPLRAQSRAADLAVVAAERLGDEFVGPRPLVLREARLQERLEVRRGQRLRRLDDGMHRVAILLVRQA